MTTVLVTGSQGFIGKNLCAHLSQRGDISLLKFESSDNINSLRGHLEKADFIFHLAGVNRPKNEKEFDTGNKQLTEQLVELLIESGKSTPILITSSIQAELDNAYGKSKKAAEDVIFNYSARFDTSVYVYRLPNVFGKWCRPNYNSVVATFCHNITHNLPITMSDPRHKLNLVYIDEVIAEFIKALDKETEPAQDGYCHIPISYDITLQELKDTLSNFNNSRDSLIMPNLESNLSRYLYATYTSYLPKDGFGYTLNASVDDRGWLGEFIKSKQFGQIFVSKTKPGVTRGNHWHNTKIEKFLVVDGLAEITFRKLGTDEVINYEVSGDNLTVLDIPAGYVHAIKNVGKSDLTTIFWADEILDPDKPDTIFENVERKVTKQ